MQQRRSRPIRTVVKSCRVTLAEDRQLRKAAEERGVTMTTLLRQRILRDSGGAGDE